MYDAIPQGGMNIVYKSTDMALASTFTGSSKTEPKIRKEFPESWIYESVDDLGLVVWHFQAFFVSVHRVLAL